MGKFKKRKKENAELKELIDEISVSTITKEMHKHAFKRLPNPEFNAFKQLIKLFKTGKCLFCSYHRQNNNSFIF